jgi:hypothetical protein
VCYEEHHSTVICLKGSLFSNNIRVTGAGAGPEADETHGGHHRDINENVNRTVTGVGQEADETRGQGPARRERHLRSDGLRTSKNKRPAVSTETVESVKKKKQEHKPNGKSGACRGTALSSAMSEEPNTPEKKRLAVSTETVESDKKKKQEHKPNGKSGASGTAGSSAVSEEPNAPEKKSPAVSTETVESVKKKKQEHKPNGKSGASGTALSSAVSEEPKRRVAVRTAVMSTAAVVAPSPHASPSQANRYPLHIHAPFLSQFIFMGETERIATTKIMLEGLGMSVETLQVTSDPMIFTIASPISQICRMKKLILNDGREASYYASSVRAVAEVEIDVGAARCVATIPLASIELIYSRHDAATRVNVYT